MRGNTPPTTRSPSHRSRPAGNPPNRQPATVGKEKRGGRGPTSRRTSTRAAPERRPPPTVGAYAPTPPATREGGRTAAPRHAVGGEPRPGPAPARPAAATSHATPPANHNSKAGKADALSSATGPSTARCSKDVTHHHRPGARRRPCPVAACSGQPLPGKRSFSSPLRDRNFFRRTLMSFTCR